MTNLPENGAVIIFDLIPTASYCSPGVTYRVERNGKEFRFESVVAGTSTFDPAWAVSRSVWRYAARTHKDAEALEAFNTAEPFEDGSIFDESFRAVAPRVIA